MMLHLHIFHTAASALAWHKCLARAVVSMHFAAACPRAFYVSSRPLFPVATLLCCRPAAARARYVLVVVWSLATSANEAKPRPED